MDILFNTLGVIMLWVIGLAVIPAFFGIVGFTMLSKYDEFVGYGMMIGAFVVYLIITAIFLMSL